MTAKQQEIRGPLLARLLGVTTRTLHNLRTRGMPHRRDGREVWYPVPTCLAWYFRSGDGAAAAPAPTVRPEIRPIPKATSFSVGAE